ncbi:MAG: hypothetical protein M3329_00280 [Pseudomonadota bacterium]|nr:hypothetical protein [Pseudomonadota bacterium]
MHESAYFRFGIIKRYLQRLVDGLDDAIDRAFLSPCVALSLFFEDQIAVVIVNSERQRDQPAKPLRACRLRAARRRPRSTLAHSRTDLQTARVFPC